MGAKVTLCAPPTLTPVAIQDFIENCGLENTALEQNMDKAVKDADVIMMLRLQRERQQRGLIPTLREYSKFYQLNEQRLAKAKPGALVMHPGPMNEGIEISSEVAHGAQSVIEEQVSNGIAVRMALFYLLAGGKITGGV